MNFSVYTVMMWFILLAMRRTPRCLNCCLLSIYRLFLAWCRSRLTTLVFCFLKAGTLRGWTLSSWRGSTEEGWWLTSFCLCWEEILLVAWAILAAISAFLLFSASAFSASFAFLAASFFAVSSSFTVGFFGTGCFCDDLFFFLYRLLWITVEYCFPHCAFP